MSTNEYQKYPTDKKKYDKEYLRVFGIKCLFCNGRGWVYEDETVDTKTDCPICHGIGYIEKPKGSDYLRMKKDQEKGIANYE